MHGEDQEAESCRSTELINLLFGKLKMSKQKIWTDEQVAELNKYQEAHEFHPYTCGNRNDGNHKERFGDLGVLVATNYGWMCPDCDYTQNWAHGLPKGNINASDTKRNL